MPLLFSSYLRDDKVAVTKLSARQKGEFYYEIWIDAVSIPGGEDWRREIRKGIDAADQMLLMLTPDACASNQVKEEVDYAMSVGRTIVPLMIKRVTSDDLNKLGVERLNYIDFVTNHDDRFAWEKLIEALPEVLPIHKRLLDPKFKALHHDYLRSLFTRYGRVKLTYLLDAAPREQVSLFDVYVPLFLGIRLHGEIKDGKLVDWWVTSQKEAERSHDTLPEAEKQERRPKQFPRMNADPEIVERLVGRMKQFGAGLGSPEGGVGDGEHALWRLESEEAPALTPHLVITGDPGSGKSTLMQHLALCLAGDMLGDETARADLNVLGFWPLPAYTPVFVELRALVRSAFADVRNAVTLEQFYTFLEKAQLKPYGATGYLEDLKAQMREGGVMFFLDGLDEVPDAGTPERREQIRAFVTLLREQFPKCRILVTSRPYAYAGDWQLEGFGQVDLAALEPHRLEELAVNLFTVVLGEARAKTQAEAFKRQFERVPERLRGSPLFFTLMAAIWLNNQKTSETERLPVSEDAVYRACVDMLIRRWTRKDLDGGASVAELIGLDEGQLRQVLEMLAYQVHSEIGERDDAAFVGARIFDTVRKLKLRGVDFDMLLDTLAQRAGVIYERRYDEFQFAHLSFQEHLAACYLAAPERYPAQIARHVGENPTRWQNVMQLFPDEAQRQGRNLWDLIRLWLPKDVVIPTDRDDPHWSVFAHAARLLLNRMPADHELQEVYRPRLQRALRVLVERGALTPPERAEMGRLLIALGDPRKGVGLAEAGLPDIDWVLVPDDGEWTYQDSKHPPLPPFRISRYPITFAQFQAFLDAPVGFNDERWWDGMPEASRKRRMREQAFKYINHPREQVSWYQAVAFCRWLSAKLGVEVRLPTEQQWEKAARGTDGREYPWGREYIPGYANINELRDGRGPYNLRQPSAVGMYPQAASPYGILDMSGNVWEWCLNKYDDPTQVNVDASGDIRVLRGGSCIVDSVVARCTARSMLNPKLYYRSVGFRVVCASPTSGSEL